MLLNEIDPLEIDVTAYAKKHFQVGLRLYAALTKKPAAEFQESIQTSDRSA